MPVCAHALPTCIIASIFAFVSVPSVCGASACMLPPCCLHLPRLFSNFLSSSACVSPLSHFLKCLRSSADRQLRLDRPLSPPHPGESRPPRWSVCHNKSVCRRCSNASEGLCVLVRGGLGGTPGCHTCQPGMRWKLGEPVSPSADSPEHNYLFAYVSNFQASCCDVLVYSPASG